MTWLLIFACAAAVILLIIGRSEHEKRYFAVDTYQVCSEKIVDGERTFVFLTDLHSNCFGKGQKELLDAIEKIKPDGILIGGDMMVTYADRESVETEVALYLVECLAKRYPVYYGMGNHESRMWWKKDRLGNAYEEYCQKLEGWGVKLVKGPMRYEIGTDISLAGVELPKACYRRLTPEQVSVDDIGKQTGDADRKRFQILLSHTPAYFAACKGWGADLVLSGHYHGGTIRLPVLGGVMTPQGKFFDRYCGGMFEEEGRVLIVGRGLGTHSVNIRLNNRAELVVVKVGPGKGHR